MRFSQRMGLTPVADVIQVDGMNDDLRAGLWNVLFVGIFDLPGFIHKKEGYRSPARIENFSTLLWSDYFKKPVDSRPDYNSRKLKFIREYYFGCEWHAVYDFIEFCVGIFGRPIIEPLNFILER